LAAQKRRIAEEAKKQGWEITAWKTDTDTGKNTDRPALREALEIIADGQADGLVAAKLDRVARSTVDFGILLNWFEAGGKVLAVLDLALDTSTPTGKFVAHMLASVAEFEAALIAERTTAALAAKRSSGLPICRPSVCDNPTLKRRIEKMRDKGLSLRAIAEKLNQEGVKTLRGGECWRASSVSTALGYKPPRVHKPASLPTIRRRQAA
jgi:DNA invertase Pin-like site-specific DNA recombinase